MATTRMKVSLSQEMHAAILQEARRRRVPAARLVRSILKGWLAAHERASVADEIRRFAHRHAGTEIDLSPAIEEVALAELRRLADDEAG